MSEKRLIDSLNESKPIDVPWNVWRFIGDKQIDLAGDQARIGGDDFGTKEELRTAVEFYVTQLGGKVKWEK